MWEENHETSVKSLPLFWNDTPSYKKMLRRVFNLPNLRSHRLLPRCYCYCFSISFWGMKVYLKIDSDFYLLMVLSIYTQKSYSMDVFLIRELWISMSSYWLTAHTMIHSWNCLLRNLAEVGIVKQKAAICRRSNVAKFLQDHLNRSNIPYIFEILQTWKSLSYS